MNHNILNKIEVCICILAFMGAAHGQTIINFEDSYNQTFNENGEKVLLKTFQQFKNIDKRPDSFSIRSDNEIYYRPNILNFIENINTNNPLKINQPIYNFNGYNGDVLIVDDEGDGNATSIQEAIDIAKPFDTIMVYSGVYNENITINKELNIIGLKTEYETGVDYGKPKIIGISGSSIVNIISDYTNFSGFNITQSNTNPSNVLFGIEIYANFSNIYNNEISNLVFGDGILVEGSENRVVNNSIHDNPYYGIISISSLDDLYVNNTFSNNTMSNNLYGGLAISGQVKSYVSNNSFYNDGMFAVPPIDIEVYNNFVNGKPLIYLQNTSNFTIDGDAGQILILQCDNITIIGQEISNTICAMEIIESQNCILINNTISQCIESGLYIVLSDNILVENNKLILNGYEIVDEQTNGTVTSYYGTGLTAAYSSNLIVQNSSISENYAGGIGFQVVNDSILFNNNIEGNLFGAWLMFSSRNEIYNNNFFNNDWNNIYLIDFQSIPDAVINLPDSTNNVIWFNNLYPTKDYSNNTRTINIGPFEIKLSNTLCSEDYTWYNSNQWDNGAIGNYWSMQWLRYDLDYDGINDVPTKIPIYGIDNYPLIAPINEVPDNTSPNVEIKFPEEGRLYFGNIIPSVRSPFNNTGIFSFWIKPLELKIYATDESGISFAFVYIDEYNPEKPLGNKLVPLRYRGSDIYTGYLDFPLFGPHTLIFVVGDKYGFNLFIKEMEVTCLYLPIPYFIS